MKFFKNFDLFGFQMTFNINSHDTYRTVIGGILSILFFLSFLTMLSLFGENCFKKNNPEGYTKIIHPDNKDKKKLKLNEISFLGGFQIYDDDSKVINLDEYFFPKFYFNKHFYNKTNGKYESDSKEIKAIKCNEILLDDKIESGIFDLSKFYCPNLSEISDESLEGNYSTDILNTLVFTLNVCNDKEYKDCKDLDKIFKLFEEKHIWISGLFPKVNYIIDNQNKPFHLELFNYYNFISPNKYVYDEIILSKYELEDDRGIFFEDLNKIVKIGVSKNSHFPLVRSEKSVISKNNINEKNNKFYTAYFYFDQHQYFYSRYYKKLPDVFAQIFGTLDIIIIFVIFFYNIYCKIRFDSFLFKRSIIIEDENSKDLQENLNKFSSEEIENIKKLFRFKEENKNNKNKFKSNKNYKLRSRFMGGW